MGSNLILLQEHTQYVIKGKIVLSVGEALCKYFLCPQFVKLGLNWLFILFVVLTMSWQCPSNIRGLSSSLEIFILLSLP